MMKRKQVKRARCPSDPHVGHDPDVFIISVVAVTGDVARIVVVNPSAHVTPPVPYVLPLTCNILIHLNNCFLFKIGN